MTRQWPPPSDPPVSRAEDARRMVYGVCQLVCLWVAEDKTVRRWTR